MLRFFSCQYCSSRYAKEYDEWIEWPRQAALLRKRLPSRTAAACKLAVGTPARCLPSPPSVVREAQYAQQDDKEHNTVTQQVVVAGGQTNLIVHCNLGKWTAKTVVPPNLPGGGRKKAAFKVQKLYL